MYYREKVICSENVALVVKLLTLLVSGTACLNVTLLWLSPGYI